MAGATAVMLAAVLLVFYGIVRPGTNAALRILGAQLSALELRIGFHRVGADGNKRRGAELFVFGTDAPR